MKKGVKILCFVFLLIMISFVSAESCLSDSPCSLCPGTNQNTPKSYNLNVTGIKNCTDHSDSYLNGEYELTQRSENWSLCTWDDESDEEVSRVWTYLSKYDDPFSVPIVMQGDRGSVMYFLFYPDSCIETMEADIYSGVSSCSNIENNPDEVYGGHAVLTSCDEFINCSKPKYEYKKCNSADSEDFVCCKDEDRDSHAVSYSVKLKETCNPYGDPQGETRPMSECGDNSIIGECGQCMNIAGSGEPYDGKCVLNSAPKTNGKVCCGDIEPSGSLSFTYRIDERCSSKEKIVPDFYCFNYLYALDNEILKYSHSPFKFIEVDRAIVGGSEEPGPYIFIAGSDAVLAITPDDLTDTHNPLARVETDKEGLICSSFSGEETTHNLDMKSKVSTINDLPEIDSCHFFSFNWPEDSTRKYSLRNELPAFLSFSMNGTDDGEVNQVGNICGDKINKKPKTTIFDSKNVVVCPESVTLKNSVTREVYATAYPVDSLKLLGAKWLGGFPAGDCLAKPVDEKITISYRSDLNFKYQAGRITIDILIQDYAYYPRSDIKYATLGDTRNEVLNYSGISTLLSPVKEQMDDYIDTTRNMGFTSADAVLFNELPGDYSFTDPSINPPNTRFLPMGIWQQSQGVHPAKVYDRITIVIDRASGRVVIGENIWFEQNIKDTVYGKILTGDAGDTRRKVVLSSVWTTDLETIGRNEVGVAWYGLAFIGTTNNQSVFDWIYTTFNDKLKELKQQDEVRSLNEVYYLHNNGSTRTSLDGLSQEEKNEYTMITVTGDKISPVIKDPLLKKANLFTHCYSDDKVKTNTAESKSSVYLVRDEKYTIEGPAYSVVLDNEPAKNITKLFNESGYISILDSEDVLSGCDLQVINEVLFLINPGEEVVLSSSDGAMEILIEEDSVLVPTVVTIKDIEIINCSKEGLFSDSFSYEGLDPSLADYADYLYNLDTEGKFIEGILNMEDYLSNITLSEFDSEISVTRKLPEEMYLLQPTNIILEVRVSDESGNLTLEDGIPSGWTYVDSEDGEYSGGRVLFRLSNVSSDIDVSYSVIPENYNATFYGDFGVLGQEGYFVANISGDSSGEILEPDKDYLLFRTLKTVQDWKQGIKAQEEVGFAIDLWKEHTTPVEEPVVLCNIADVDGDGDVDWDDMNTGGCYADLNRDGIWDTADFILMKSNFGETTATLCRRLPLSGIGDCI